MNILIVEDERKIANSLKQGLEQEGYIINVAYDGDDGYDRAITEKYNLIILDLMLPGMNGFEICSSLREDKIETPILMLTAKSELEDKVEGLNIGADDYLTKPFAFEELLARIKSLLRRPDTFITEKITSSDLEIDVENYEVKRDGKRIELSKKEFELLEYLMRHKGRVLTKENIIDNVWDYDSDVLPNTVEVYIGYLRNKIDKAFPKKPQIIKTVRGFGYTIEEDDK